MLCFATFAIQKSFSEGYSTVDAEIYPAQSEQKEISEEQTTNIATGIEAVVPQWKDVAPPVFQDIDTQKVYKVPLKQYWQDRRKSFENSIAKCQEKCTSDTLQKCYDSILTLEKSKTEMREQMYVQNARSILNDK